MKKMLLLIFILIIGTIIACKQVVEKGAMEKKEEAMAKETPKVEATGDAAVDAVGNDLNTVNGVEKDLSTDELDDLDLGLSDIQNI